MAQENLDKAKKIFVFYFNVIAEQAGVYWIPEFDKDIELAVDNLMIAVEDMIDNKISQNEKEGNDDWREYQ